MQVSGSYIIGSWAALPSCRHCQTLCIVLDADPARGIAAALAAKVALQAASTPAPSNHAVSLGLCCCSAYRCRSAGGAAAESGGWQLVGGAVGCFDAVQSSVRLCPARTDAAPREELQQRLAAKVAALREERHAHERAKKTEAAKRFRATNGRVEKQVIIN